MPKISLEIGPRTSPFIGELRPDLVDPDSTVVYVEKRFEWANRLKKIFRGDEGVIQADASNLPFDRGSVDAIFAKDVLGSIGRFVQEPDGFNLTHLEAINPNYRKEWNDVCGSGSKVVILEIATPPDKDDTIRQFQTDGFDLSEEYDSNTLGRITGKPWLFDRIQKIGDEFALIFEKNS